MLNQHSLSYPPSAAGRRTRHAVLRKHLLLTYSAESHCTPEVQAGSRHKASEIYAGDACLQSRPRDRLTRRRLLCCLRASRKILGHDHFLPRLSQHTVLYHKNSWCGISRGTDNYYIELHGLSNFLATAACRIGLVIFCTWFINWSSSRHLQWLGSLQYPVTDNVLTSSYLIP
jgi:hypothetical protein